MVDACCRSGDGIIVGGALITVVDCSDALSSLDDSAKSVLLGLFSFYF